MGLLEKALELKRNYEEFEKNQKYYYDQIHNITFEIFRNIK